MRHTLSITVVLAVVLAFSAAALGESVSVLLEKAVFKKETAGDLDAAIKIYKQIVEDAKANRKYVAEAHYRLGVCLMKQKKNAEAVAVFRKLIADFPDQKKFVSKARKNIAESRRKIAGLELAKIVEDVVLTISTCAATDPQVKKSLASLEGLNEQATVKAVAKFLDSEKNTVRRSAIYILWKGDFANITPAVSGLMKVCKHKEGLTRGMAAIALGGRKIDSAFQIMCAMTLKDQSPHARRCAAYALGLMGRADAKPVLERALKDENVHVRNNAEAALTMISRAQKTIEFLPLNKVVERTVYDDGSGRECLIDIDTGKVFGPHALKGMDKGKVFIQLAKMGIDAGAETSRSGPGLWGIDMIVIPRVTEPWEKITLLGITDELATGKPGTPAVMSALGELPRTYAFKTREGSMGVLQIIEIVGKKPAHIKIRYKLLKHGQQPDENALSPQARLPQEVMAYIVDLHMEAYKKAQDKGLRINTRMYGVDAEFNKYFGGFITFKNRTGKVVSNEIPLGNSSRPWDVELGDDKGVPQKYRVEKRDTKRRGKYRLWWTPSKPVQPGEVRLLGYLNRKTQKLPQIEGGCQLKMNNHFGSPVLENFFLVIPYNVAIAEQSRDYISRKRIGVFDIYLWQREVPANTTNSVTVVLKEANLVSKPKFKITIQDNTAVNLDSGNVTALKKEWPDAFDLAWDNDVRGILMRKPKSSVRMLTLPDAKDFDQAVRLARKRVSELRKSETRAVPGATCRYLSVLTNEGKLAVIQIGKFDRKQAAIEWSIVSIPGTKTRENARTVAEAFLSAAIAGKDAEAIKLTDPRSAVPQQVKDFREFPDAKSLKIVSVYADDKTALAVTTETRADHGRKGPLLIRLIKQRGLWVVTDIDVETPAKAKDKLKRFLKKHPDAKPVPLEPVKKAAVVAADKWLNFVDQGKYDTSWDKAAAFFKAAVTKQKWVASMKSVRAPLGKVKSRKLLSARYTTSLPGAPDGEYVVIQYQTSFENKKNAVETITPMKDKDGKWRVSGYYIK